MIFFRKVPVCDRDRHLGDVAHLASEVTRHVVDALGQVPPYAGDFANLRLSAELSVSADFASNARHLRGENAELLDHSVYDFRRAQKFSLERTPFHIERDGLLQIALRDRGDRVRNRGGGPKQIVDQGIDGTFHLAPGAGAGAQPKALARPSLPSNGLADLLQLLGHPLVRGNNVIESVRDLAGQANFVRRQPGGKVAAAHRLQSLQQTSQILLAGVPFPVACIASNPLRLRRRNRKLISVHHGTFLNQYMNQTREEFVRRQRGGARDRSARPLACASGRTAATQPAIRSLPVAAFLGARPQACPNFAISRALPVAAPMAATRLTGESSLAA